MPSTSIDGCSIYYEVLGQGLPIVLTPGGQASLETVRVLAEKLASEYRVILWDRANLGRSEVVFKGAADLDLWSDELAELLHRLDAAPAYLAGASSGSRVSYRTALRYPEVVRGLFLWLVTGGSPIAERLGQNYYGQFADLAETEGMQAVVESTVLAGSTSWAQRVEINPANRGRLLAMDPGEFARVLRRWQRFFRADDPVIGITADELRRISVPTCLIAGCDESHRRDRSELVAQLIPDVEFLDPPGFCEEWAQVSRRGPTGTMFAHIPILPDLIRDFINRTEARA